MRKMDISNGEGIGVALFVQGCHFHCKDCFNYETWAFNGGKEWNEKTEQTFLNLVGQEHVCRATIIGGEPLAEENVAEVQELIKKIREQYPNKKIWLYTGYTWEDIFHGDTTYFGKKSLKLIRRETLSLCDVVVDGQFITELKDMNLHWRGSSNQRVIDVQESIRKNDVILYCE